MVENFMLFSKHEKSLELPGKESALPDRAQPAQFSPMHFVSGNTLVAPYPETMITAVFGMGCFWGAERLFWEIPGVFSTAAGYSGGSTVNPSYEDVCSGMTGHSEVVLVVYDPSLLSYQDLLQAFWDSHDPTQGMRQGNDRGSQYRSVIYTTDPQQLLEAQASAEKFQLSLDDSGLAKITTEINAMDQFFYADDYHQQYLAKNPAGYCGLAGTGACYVPEPVNS